MRLQETEIGLLTVKIGAIGLALVASLDAFLTGATSKPRYLILLPILAALFLGDIPTGAASSWPKDFERIPYQHHRCSPLSCAIFCSRNNGDLTPIILHKAQEV
jgi:hypothetical protein